jgi:hypothetical protein
MVERSNRDLSFGVIVLFFVLLAGGVAVIHKASKNDRSLEILPRAHKQLLALPIGAERTVPSPHEFRGECHSCHPLAAAAGAAGMLSTYQPLAGVAAAGGAFGAPPMAPRQATPPFSFRPAQNPQAAANAGPMPASPAARAGQADTGGAAAAVNRQDAAAPGEVTGILSPVEQNAADKIPVEGHWLGMETVDLTAPLRSAYRIPANVSGVIVDEITLESAESGILAGDVITSIEDRKTPDLGEFFRATLAVSAEKQAEVVVCRVGVEKRFMLAAKNSPVLGFAAMEGAQPIRPGALSPHRQRRQACTACHVIMTTGGQLPVDAGDILPSPPPIPAGARAPHAYRGACNSCHPIMR